MLYLDWRFLPVYDQIDPTTAHSGAYDVGLVALSMVVATLAAFVALSISGRIVASNSRGARWAWASAGALAMGWRHLEHALHRHARLLPALRHHLRAGRHCAVDDPRHPGERG